MMELVQERREREKRVLEGEEDAAEKEDLFGSLVRAAAEEREDDGIPFGDREVIGNTCDYLVLVLGKGLAGAGGGSRGFGWNERAASRK